MSNCASSTRSSTLWYYGKAIAPNAPTSSSNTSVACWRGRSSMSTAHKDVAPHRELPWELRRRGFKDSLRHDQRVKEAIRKNLRELIAEEAIITSDGTKKVRIPLRYLDQYRFKYGQPPQGVGQGRGQPGDVLGRHDGHGNAPDDGQPGDQPREPTYEVEVPLEELTQMMLEDLALPWLAEKPERQMTTISHR